MNQDKVAIPKSWILLDSQSTVDGFSNPMLITNIRDAKHMPILYCNAGKVSVTQKVGQYGTTQVALQTSYTSTIYRRDTSHI